MRDVLGAMRAMQAPDWEQVFYVNSSIADGAIGVVLLQKGKGSQYMHPMYCANRVKNGGRENIVRDRVGDGQCGVCLSTILLLSFATPICVLDKLYLLALAY